MNRFRVLILITVCFILFIISKPIYSKADFEKNIGNVFGIEENIILMKEDLLFLNREIEKLRGECK